MSDKTFKIVLVTVLVLGVIGTVCMVGYTMHLRENCSIITFISNER